VGTFHMSDNRQMAIAMQQLVDFISMVTNNMLLCCAMPNITHVEGSHISFTRGKHKRTSFFTEYMRKLHKKVKLSMCLINQKGMDIYIHIFLKSVGGGWPASSPWGKSPHYPWVGHRAGLDSMEKSYWESNSDPTVAQPLARCYTDC
jgi:hypothetical protein